MSEKKNKNKIEIEIHTDMCMYAPSIFAKIFPSYSKEDLHLSTKIRTPLLLFNAMLLANYTIRSRGETLQ